MTKAKNPIQYLDPSTLRIVDEPLQRWPRIASVQVRSHLLRSSQASAWCAHMDQPAAYLPSFATGCKKGVKEPVVCAPASGAMTGKVACGGSRKRKSQRRSGADWRGRQHEHATRLPQTPRERGC